LKITECVPIFLPAVGGTELATFKLSNELAKEGHEVTVLTHNTTNRDYSFGLGLRCSMNLPSYEQMGQIRVFRFPFTYVKRAASVFSIQQAQALGSIRPDILHMQGFFDLPNLFVMLYTAKRFRIPAVVTTHAFFESYLTMKNRGLEFGLSAIIQILGTMVSRVIALSESERKYLIGLGLSSSQIVVIPNGVDLNEFDSGADEDPKIQGVSAQSFIFCMARYSRYKNIETLIKAFSSLSDPSVKLVIAGKVTDQGYFDELKSKTKEGSTFLLSNISETQKRWLYRNCICFVLPSKRETSPLSVLEAMASKKPVIASNSGAISELVQNDVTGFLFDPGDAIKLAGLLQEMLSNSLMRSRMGAKARIFAEDRSWPKIALKTVEEFENSSRIRRT
jgi:glycosyltransferase involved in cell wall biosynthesis